MRPSTKSSIKQVLDQRIATERYEIEHEPEEERAELRAIYLVNLLTFEPLYDHQRPMPDW